MDQNDLKAWNDLQERSLHTESRNQLRLAGLLVAGGLLVVAEAGFANLSTQVSLQQSLYRGYLLLLVPVLGFLLAALTLAGLIAAAGDQRRAQRAWERLPAEVRERFPGPRPGGTNHLFSSLTGWGICILWMAAWGVILVLTSMLL